MKESNKGKLLTYLIVVVAIVVGAYVMMRRTTTISTNGVGGTGDIPGGDSSSPGGISYMLKNFIDGLLSPLLGAFGYQRGPEGGVPAGADDWRDHSPEEDGTANGKPDKTNDQGPSTPNTPTDKGTTNPPVYSTNTGTTSKDRVVTIRTQLPIAQRTFDPFKGALAGAFGKPTLTVKPKKHTRSGKQRYGGGPGA